MFLLLLPTSLCLPTALPVEDILAQAADTGKWQQTRIELLKTGSHQVQAGGAKVYLILPTVQSGHVPESVYKDHKDIVCY